MTTLTITWPLATTRVNGAALAAAQIQATKMYMSINGGSYSVYATRAPTDAQSSVLTSMNPGTYRFKFETVDTDNQVGPQSEPVDFVIGTPLPALPNPPNIAGVTIVQS